VVGLKETEGAPLATSPTQLVDGAVNLVVTASLEALATPPVSLTSAQPKAVFRPVVGGIASPTIVILLWAVKREVIVQAALKTDLPAFVLLRPLFLRLLCLLFLGPCLLFLLGCRRGVAFGLIL